jgi:hypothetical protein
MLEILLPNQITLISSIGMICIDRAEGTYNTSADLASRHLQLGRVAASMAQSAIRAGYYRSFLYYPP